MYMIENEYLRVQVKNPGAELCGIYSKVQQREYMWQASWELWEHSSMLLFPNPGRISRDRTVIDGREYPASMHGFVYGKDFEVTEHTKDSLTMELRSDEDTRRSFPYEFTLRVRFFLHGDTLMQELAVINCDDRPVYFCLGAHPGFYLPICLGESGDDHIIRFDCPQSIRRLSTQPGTMLLTGERTEFLSGETDIQLSEGYFNNGSLLLEGVNAKRVTLMSRKSGHFVEMGIEGFPYMCLWGNPVKNAFICIEPWCGTSDFADTDHVWEHKTGIEKADVGGSFIRTLSFRVG